LTITTTHQPATDLGYLLRKSPKRLHTFELSFGQAHVFYPESTNDRCSATLLLDVDAIGLVRGRRKSAELDSAMQQYVNDRPYVISSFMSVAIGQVYRNAMSGESKERPALAAQAIPLIAELDVIPCRGGEAMLRRLFEPLGYVVSAEQLVLDASFPDWGTSPYFSVRLEQTCRLQDLLSHLYVLIPVLDNAKHYWVGDDEVEKLLRRGGEWLARHPDRTLIADRYLKRQRSLTRRAVARLIEQDQPDIEEEATEHAEEEEAVERPLDLHEQRLNTVMAALRNAGARRVLDLGCGEGKLLQALIADRSFDEVVGVEVSYRSLERARQRLRVERMPERQAQRIKLIHGSLTYKDPRLSGFDAAALVEVIEHLDESRLPALEEVVFQGARPATVLVTTPNAEYNVQLEALPAGQLRHRDHRFEWTRGEFETWGSRVASRHGYSVRFLPIGTLDEELGAPTQMAVFSR
jgi:3' terminal RNA ribose 2'-O-methyltransferase Hen1